MGCGLSAVSRWFSIALSYFLYSSSSRYMVDHGSELFYNYTPLVESNKDKAEEPVESTPPPPPSNNQMPPPSNERFQSMGPPMSHQMSPHPQSFAAYPQQSPAHMSHPGSYPHQGNPAPHQIQLMEAVQSQHHGQHPNYQPQYPQQQYGMNPYHQTGGPPLQLQQAPQMNHSEHQSAANMHPQPGGGFGPEVYIPPEIVRNPRRATRGSAAKEGMYRV